jgi:uncharacterized protein (DUF427 family)
MTICCAGYIPGKERISIWNFPTPPSVESVSLPIHVIFNGVLILRTFKAKRVLVTGHAPEYFIPPEDVKMEYLTPVNATSECRWKGLLHYVRIEIAGRRAENAAWYFPTPLPDYLELENYLGFDAHRMDGCYVDGEKTVPDPLPPYRGWITSDIVGPFVIRRLE